MCFWKAITNGLFCCLVVVRMKARLRIMLRKRLDKYRNTFSYILTPFSCFFLCFYYKCCDFKLTGAILLLNSFWLDVPSTTNFTPSPVLQLHAINFMLSLTVSEYMWAVSSYLILTFPLLNNWSDNREEGGIALSPETGSTEIYGQCGSHFQNIKHYMSHL